MYVFDEIELVKIGIGAEGEPQFENLELILCQDHRRQIDNW